MVEIICYGYQKSLAFIFLIIFSLPVFFFSFMADASAEKRDWKKEQGKDLPITVTSDRMISFQKENKVIFYGNVIAVRGDVTIRSEELEIYNAPDGSKTEKIIARKNVVIDSNGRHATGEEAVYYDVTQRIILTGNAKAWEDNNEIIGDKMIFLLDEDRFIVDGGEKKGKQIKLTFYPKDEKGKTKKKGRKNK